MQKKIIEISGEMVRKNIVRACNISEYFALICGEELMYQHMNKASCVLITIFLTPKQFKVNIRFVFMT